MSGRLDLRRWIQVYHPAYAVVQSGDGQYVVVGTEVGAAIFTLGGHRLVTYPLDGRELPVHQLCAPLDFERLALATRLGDVVLFDLEASDSRFEIKETRLHSTACDIHRLSFCAVEERVAIGHLSFALTVIDLGGRVVWRQQDRGAAGLGTTWSVDLAPGGKRLYAGSAGIGTNWLVVLDAATGIVQHKRECGAPVNAVSVLAEGQGVAVLSPGGSYTVRLTVYDSELGDIRWEQELDSPATALAADTVEPLLAVSTGYEGDIHVLSASTGARLAVEPLRSMVNDLSLVRGSFVAAATQDGNVALMRYLS